MDNYLLHEKYPNHWAVLAGKEYQVVDEFYDVSNLIRSRLEVC